MRGIVTAAVGGMAYPINSYESVIMSMIINTQPARSIDENLLCVSFVNIW